MQGVPGQDLPPAALLPVGPPAGGEPPKMKKHFAVLFSLAALPALAVWLRAADSTDDPARAAFERGNALLRDARKACELHEPDLLRQAAGQYRECLESPTNRLDAGTLFKAA